MIIIFITISYYGIVPVPRIQIEIQIIMLIFRNWSSQIIVILIVIEIVMFDLMTSSWLLVLELVAFELLNQVPLSGHWSYLWCMSERELGLRYVALVDLKEYRKRNLTTIGAMRRRGARKAGIFMHQCMLSPLVADCGDMFSRGRSVWVACEAELWPRKVCDSAGSSFALRSCTACPCSYVFMRGIRI